MKARIQALISIPFANAAIQTDGFVPYPVAADGSNDSTSPAWVECAGMSVGARHPRQAWSWLNFLSQRWLVKRPI